jgi:hypothetical protein
LNKAHEDFLPWNVLQANLSDLGLALDADNAPLIRALLKDLMQDYQPDGKLVDWVWIKTALTA